MGFLGLCDGDPVVESLRTIFGANVLRVPRDDLGPTKVIAVRDGDAKLMGNLGDILTGQTAFSFPEADIHSGPAPTVLNQTTKAVDLELGATILGGFLQGFGVSSAGLKAAFGANTAIAFRFSDIKRVALDVNRLGRALMGQAVDRSNPASSCYFGAEPSRFLVVDSVLTSPSFSVTAWRSRHESGQISLPTLAGILAPVSAKVAVTASSASEVTFTGGESSLAFAFSCLEVLIDDAGRIVGLVGQTGQIRIQSLDAAPDEAGQQHPRGILLTAEPALLDLDLGMW